MKYKISIILFVALILAACTFSGPRKAIAHSDEQVSDLSMDSLLLDTTKVLMPELPIYFDSTRVLIHPVGFVKMIDSRYSKNSFISKSDSYKGDDGVEHPVLYSHKNNINGNMVNLLFEDVDKSTGLLPLTDKAINITEVEYLREIARSTKNEYLLYKIQDKDTNRDGKLNTNDITALYISNLNGTELIKLSEDKHNFYKHSWAYWCNRYYFISIEDTNKDGLFDRQDKFHYHYIDFSIKPYKLVEYNPLESFLK